MDDTYGRGPLLLLSGRANRPLAVEIGEQIGKSPDGATIKKFADGEIFVRIDRNARGRDVFIIQSTNSPAENIMELLLMIDAATRASAARVTAVIPYFGYGRQDRKDQPRVAIGAKLVANLIVAAGADRVISIDFHQHQIQGFFDIPVDHLYAAPVFTRYFKNLGSRQPRRGRPRRGLGEDGPWLRAPSRRHLRDHRQAAPEGEHVGGAERGR
jgi:ribose-phosphate pyrophosphokinase